MLKDFKFNKISLKDIKLKDKKINILSMAAVAVAVTAFGVAAMCVTGAAAAPKTAGGQNTVVADAQTLSLPGAGMGYVIEDYVGATSGSSVEFLSTTALASSLDDSFNEYYDANGSTLGKLIVYSGEEAADVYDKIQGNERIENGEEVAKVVGHMYAGDVATLVRVQGGWFQIISDSVNGYVRNKGFARGVEAEALDGYTYVSAAFANSNDVYLYEDWDSDEVICVLPVGIRYTLLDSGDVFSKIYVPGVGEGWVYNDDMTFAVVRRYAALVSSEIDTANRINEGVAAAASIEPLEDPEESSGESFNYATINIAPAAPDSEDTAALRQAIANYAQQFVGILPYVWASSDLSYGADCSGFTSAIYRAYGIEISRSSDAQTWGGTSVSIDDIRPGDIVCYSGHVALYVGDGTVVHESTPGTTASYASMYMMPIINIVRYIN